ncbi:MAG: hypothetical protein JXJ19_03590 [Elusimicrobia bacterium]|nr:hypothetical protein [Elusimicrobiota bacterium]
MEKDRPGQNLTHGQELKGMYLDLKKMAARLAEIEEKYPHAGEFKAVITRAIIELEDASHLIDSEISTVKSLDSKMKRKESE